MMDKLNNLCRQKEKLEEKIMEHYRRLDSCPTKKKSIGASLVRRMRKAGSDFISKSRRSWHEDATRRGGTDSDTSLEDVRTRQDGLSGLGTPGTRRAVYYSADENNSASANYMSRSISIWFVMKYSVYNAISGNYAVGGLALTCEGMAEKRIGGPVPPCER
ncbi:positive regulation of protein localization to cilium [Homalodisca vitripennis]|nr:positive regulation of protein localization to cilium [Homalodisca vitripennis]